MYVPGVGAGGYQVQTDELTKIAGRCDEVAGKLVKLSQSAADDSATAIAAFRGWEVSGALEGVQGSCEHNTEGFGRWADDMGDRLSGAAREYDKTEEWSMEKLRGIGV